MTNFITAIKKILVFALPIFLLASCSDKSLEPINYGDINPNIFPSDAKDIQSMVNAAYYPLRGSWGNGINTTSERGLMMIKASQTGVLFGSFDPAQAASTMNYTPNSDGFTFFYDDYNNKISMMTQYIYRIKNANIEITDEEREKAIAEIRCARGLLAYDLFTLYGPLVVAPIGVLNNPLEEKPLTRMPYDSMVAFIEADLQAAVRGLPTPPDADYGRFSTGLARMLLIRLYLHEKEWQKVSLQCDTIMQNNYYSLDPDYVSMWGLNGAKNSPEVIWAIPCDYDGTSENQWQMMALPENWPGFPGYGSIQSSWWFYDTFEDSDVRKTRLIADYTGTDNVEYNRGNPALIMNLGPIPLKIDPDNNRNTEISTVDIIMYRYADVLLSKAEAIANINHGPTQKSIDLLNQIRSRAHVTKTKLSYYSGLPQFIDTLLMERGHEFWCENGEYRDDLVRYGKLVDRVKKITGSTYANKDKILFPFSLKNINEGKGKFKQNPGYSD